MSFKSVFVLVLLFSIAAAQHCDEKADCRTCLKTKPCVYYSYGNNDFNFCSLPDVDPRLYDFKIQRASSCRIVDAPSAQVLDGLPVTTEYSLASSGFDNEGNNPFESGPYTLPVLQSLPSSQLKGRKNKYAANKVIEDVCRQFNSVYAIVHPKKSSQYERCLRKLKF